MAFLWLRAAPVGKELALTEWEGGLICGWLLPYHSESREENTSVLCSKSALSVCGMGQLIVVNLLI